MLLTNIYIFEASLFFASVHNFINDTFYRQLQTSIARAIRFEHQTHLQEGTQVL